MKNRIILFAAFVAVLGVNLHIRSFPASFPQLKKSAADTVLRDKISEISRAVDERYPGIPAPQKERLVADQFDKYRKTQQKDLQARTQEEYQREKDRFQDKAGQTYLMELDCWHWARYVDNVLRLGHPGDIVRDGKQMDMLMTYPDGYEIPWPHFLFYGSAFLYRITSFLIPGLPLNTFLFWLPLFFITLLVTALFFFCARFYGILSAIVACLFTGMAPIFVPRSVAGWFDMDILAMLFPFLIVGTYLIGFNWSGWRKALFAVLSGFWAGLFAATWGFWFVFAFIVVAFEGYSLLNLLLQHLQYKDDVRAEVTGHLVSLAAFSVSCVVFVFLFCGLPPFQDLIGQAIQGLSLNDVTVSAWPNVFATVGELKHPDFITISRTSGDILLFCLSLVGMLALLFNNHRFRGLKHESIFMFVIWFLVSFVICFKGIRFVMFVLMPMGIMLGWAIDELVSYADLRKNYYFLGAGGLVLLYAGFCTVNTGFKAAQEAYPLINDRWYNLLTTIKDDTPKDSVLNSWWDFGDWFKVVAQRHVIFDGQSQAGPRAYWMARALLSDNEKEAVAILRMLNNGGNRVFDIVDNRLKDEFRSLAVVNDLLKSDRDTARRKLNSLLPSKEAQEADRLLFSKPPHAYFIVDWSMLMKMSAISYIGDWDTSKAYLVSYMSRKKPDEMRGYLVTGLGMGVNESQKLIEEALFVPQKQLSSWISRSLYFFGSFPTDMKDEGLVFFENGSVYDPARRKFYFYDVQERSFKILHSLFTVEGDRMTETPYPDSQMKSSAVVTLRDDTYELSIFNTEIIRSLFFRLLFLHGNGLEHFKLFSEEKELASVYEIIW